MNRNQRRFGRSLKPNHSDARLRTLKDRNNNEKEVEEVLPPRSRREPGVKQKPLVNRCCYVTPERQSFVQLTEGSNSPGQFEALLVDQYAPILPEAVNNLNELRKLCSPHRGRVDNSSQYSRSFDGAHWVNVDNIEDIDKFISHRRDEGTLTHYHSLPKNFHISDVPRVKTIAEKFTKYKKNNVEVRKLDEKVVCMEYDVFDHSVVTPVQRMRAFFIVKTANKEANVLKELPSTIKNKFSISSTYLQKPSQKEVEIIDGKIIENRPYLDDLRKLLLRRQHAPKKDKNTLNLDTLYKMAKREFLEYDTVFEANLLSKEELLDVQNLILENCRSSVHGITRRTLNTSRTASGHKEVYLNGDTISRSLMTELLRERSLISSQSQDI